jgi:hypothetical protein
MSSKEFLRIIEQATTWSATHGLVYGNKNTGEGDIGNEDYRRIMTEYTFGPAPVSLYPKPIHVDAFNYMRKIQPIFNAMVDKIARDRCAFR